MDLKKLQKKKIYPKYGFGRGETIPFMIEDLNWNERSIEIMEILKTTKLGEVCGVKLWDSRWTDECYCLEWIFENYNSVRFRRAGSEQKLSNSKDISEAHRVF